MLTELLVRKFVPHAEATRDVAVRERYGVLEGWVSIVINVVVFAVKLIPGLIIGSIALIADAFHSLSDVATSVVVIWGFKTAAKPSDAEHPFGHGRVESVASLVIAVLLIVAAFEFARASVQRLLDPQPVQASPLLLLVLALSLVLKEWLAGFSFRLGAKIGSSALAADGWHHRSDVLATAVVIAALVASNFGVAWVDGAGGIVVSGFLAAAGIKLVSGSIGPLIGEAPSPRVLEEIRRIALSVGGVDEVHDVIVHHYGGLVVASLHVEVPDRIDIVHGHEIAETVEQRLNEAFGGWAVVHVDPVNRAHPLYAEVKEFLTATFARLDGKPSFHDLRIVGSTQKPFVIFDLKTDGGNPAAIAAAVRDTVAERFPHVAKVGINVEPRYVY